MPLRRLAIVSLSVIAVLPGSPLPPAAALAQAPNPCVAALADEGSSAMRAPASRASKYGRFGADSRDIRDLLQLSSASAQVRSRAAAAVARPAADRDDNNIAILEDTQGDLILRANAFDLANSGLRFERAGNGYAVTTTGGEFRATLGRSAHAWRRRLRPADDLVPVRVLRPPLLVVVRQL